jgi:hypothetical protein
VVSSGGKVSLQATEKKMKNKALVRLAVSLLDTEQGISEQSYDCLRELFLLEGMKKAWTSINNKVDACDGFFFLPKGATDELK